MFDKAIDLGSIRIKGTIGEEILHSTVSIFDYEDAAHLIQYCNSSTLLIDDDKIH